MTTTTISIPEWLDKKEYPFAHKVFVCDGLRQHYLDEGSGHPIIFVHGTPSWSFDYRHVIQSLSKRYRCLAADHIGFGLSDKPGAGYDYSPQQHAKRLGRWIDSLGLEVPFTIVVHDFGGVIGLSYALEHPERVARVVVLNSWMWSSEGEPEFKQFSKILRSPLLPFLYRYLNFSPWYLLPRSFGVRKISRAVHQHYTRPFKNRHERYGTLAFARSLLQDQGWFERLWGQRERLAEKPFLMIWGMLDRFITPKYLDKFVGGFAGVRVVKLETAGHFPQEEEPEAVAAAIEAFCGGGRGCVSG